MSAELFASFFASCIPMRSRTGKTIAARIPARSSPLKHPEMNPASVGPPEQPTSPASASIANRAVPPPLTAAEALLNVPGHIIPTEKPQTAQPTSPTAGSGTSEMQRYAAMQSRQLILMNLSRSSLSPNLPYNRRESPISAAKDIGPARSPIVLLTPRPCSANVEAHWLTACSLAPAQSIISIITQKTFRVKSCFRVSPVSPSS